MIQINKIMKVVKDHFFILALVATFIGFSAFKYAERFDDPEDGWYQVSVATGGDPGDPQDLIIGNAIATPPLTDTANCAQSNLHEMCAIELTFDRSDEDNLPEKPETVADAQSDALVTIEGDARLPENN